MGLLTSSTFYQNSAEVATPSRDNVTSFNIMTSHWCHGVACGLTLRDVKVSGRVMLSDDFMISHNTTTSNCDVNFFAKYSGKIHVA